jgi:hypothetical protein
MSRKTAATLALYALFIGAIVISLKRHHFSPKRDLPIYTCTFMGEKAGCDFDSYTWEQRQIGVQETIDGFRTCSRLYVQAESESLADFFKRVPHSKACWLMRKAAQPGGQFFPEDAHDLHVIGGLFMGEGKLQK